MTELTKIINMKKKWSKELNHIKWKVLVQCFPSLWVRTVQYTINIQIATKTSVHKSTTITLTNSWRVKSGGLCSSPNHRRGHVSLCGGRVTGILRDAGCGGRGSSRRRCCRRSRRLSHRMSLCVNLFGEVGFSEFKKRT